MRHALAFAMDAALVIFISMAVSHVLSSAVQVMACAQARPVRWLAYAIAGAIVMGSLGMMGHAIVAGLSLPRAALAVLAWMIPGYAVLEAIMRATTFRRLIEERSNFERWGTSR